MSPFHRSRDKDGPQAVPKHHSKLYKFFKKVTGAKSTPLTPGPIAAAAAKAARPGTGARVPDDHQPPAALQALPPDLPAEFAPEPSPTESTEQPTPLVSVSERLWNAAYDSLETVDAELVVSYVKTLETVLGGKTREPSAADLSAKLKDPSTRQTYMRDLLEKGRQKISRASKITTGVGNVADFILSAKKMVDLVLQSVPQTAPAALPWAGVLPWAGSKQSSL